MTTRQHSSFAIVFILGLLAMLMPLSIDMYLPALPVISAQFGVPAGSTQMTLSTYILGFALGQLIYGPMADSFGRKPVVLGGTLVFAAAAVACALANTIDQLIVMRFFHGLAAAAASVVINALMRDIYPKEEFSRMMSFVMLVTTIAPLMAPIVGGWVLVWLSWHYIFWILALAAILASAMIFFLIKETLPPERRQPFHIRTTIGNFAALFRHKRVLSYMLASGFSFAGMFSFLSAGPFVYMLNLQSKCNKKRSTHQLEYNFVSTQKPFPNDEYFLPTSYNKRARKDNDFTRTGQKTSRNCQSTGT